MRLKPKDELPTAAGGIESPYDPEARYRRRGEVAWTGYIVPLSETCGENTVHLVTHVMTTTAAVHEAGCTGPIHRALVATGPPPGEHLVDAAYVDGELVARSREELGMTLLGPPRPNPAWQSKVAGAFDLDRFEIDWEPRRARCPRGTPSSGWSARVDGTGRAYVRVLWRQADCGACPARALCTRNRHQPRNLKLQPQAQHEALRATRARLASEEGRRLYARRAGIEGTVSQGVRAFGLRRARYRGLAKTRLQHVATAAAINLERLAAWFQAVPRAATRTSRVAAPAA